MVSAKQRVEELWTSFASATEAVPVSTDRIAGRKAMAKATLELEAAKAADSALSLATDTPISP